jgi:hypothetical protein
MHSYEDLIADIQAQFITLANFRECAHTVKAIARASLPPDQIAFLDRTEIDFSKNTEEELKKRRKFLMEIR